MKLTWSKSTWVLVGSALGIVLCILVGIKILNKKSNSSGSAIGSTQGYEVYENTRFSGTYVSCLPKLINQAVTECRPGFKDDSGKYHALDWVLMSPEKPIMLQEGQRFGASGLYLPADKLSDPELKKMVGEGVFSVTDLTVK